MQPNYLSTELDCRMVIAAVRTARTIAGAEAMRPYVRREHLPGPQAQDDDALLEFARNMVRRSFIRRHLPDGARRSGGRRRAAARARRGGLRVVDCSVMPTLVSGNTNAPVVMIAEKAADMIKEEARH